MMWELVRCIVECNSSRLVKASMLATLPFGTDRWSFSKTCVTFCHTIRQNQHLLKLGASLTAGFGATH